MQFREQRRKYAVRVRHRCKVCGRPRGYIRRFRLVPDLLPRDGARGRDSRRCEVELVGGGQSV